MAILKVARLGHPVLRKLAAPVPVGQITSAETQRLIDDMVETMREYNGAGLAAPQVHALQQICVIEVNGNPRYPDAPSIPLTVLINPVVTPLTEEMEDGWEGCLSVPDMRGMVPRYTAVRLEAYDRDGRADRRWWPRSSSRASSSTRPITSTASSTSTACATSRRSRTWPSGTSTGSATRSRTTRRRLSRICSSCAHPGDARLWAPALRPHPEELRARRAPDLVIVDLTTRLGLRRVFAARAATAGSASPPTPARDQPLTPLPGGDQGTLTQELPRSAARLAA